MITNRTALSQQMSKNTAAFYPYELHEAERPDTLSHMYYSDSAMEWLLFFANDVVDPYYQWYLTDEQLTNYTISKYGSLATAQQKTHHFEVSWVNDSSIKSISEFESLPSVTPNNQKQYWAPYLDDVGNLVHYVRKRTEMTVTTNKMVRVDVDRVDGYVVGEIVYQLSGNAISASAEIELIADTYIIVKHVYGTLSGGALIGQDSGVSRTVASTSVLVRNIPAAEESYWTGISFYDYEMSLNEQRKAIRIIDKGYSEIASNNLKQMMGT